MSNILLAYDNTYCTFGSKSLIKDKIGNYKIDEAENEKEVINAVKGCNYDLIILDINMGDSDFIKLMDWLSLTCPDTSILIFSMHPESIYGLRCLQLGARGYLNKTASDEEIVLAIKTVLNGKKYINAALAEILSQSSNTKNTSNPFQNLSSREIEIALLLNSGKSLNRNLYHTEHPVFNRKYIQAQNI